MPDFAVGTVDSIYVSEGDDVFPGAIIADITIDLSGGVAYECPPHVHYSVVLNEAGTIRSVNVIAGQLLRPRDSFGTLNIFDNGVTRSAKVSVVSIVATKGLWDD